MASVKSSPSLGSARASPRRGTTGSSTTIERGTLYKMIDAIARGDRRVKWTHVLHYLDNHTYTDHEKSEDVKLTFDSPLPRYCVPTPELTKELEPCPKSGDSLLRRAVLGGAPVKIVACFCHLAPQCLTAVDSKGRVLLHLATRMPVSESSQEVLQLVLTADPLSLLQRDSNGRTPLHWLMWYHATERSPHIVHDFCRNLPKQNFLTITNSQDKIVQDPKFALPAIPRPDGSKTPHVAAILPDAVFGCLPIHYAVANGAKLNSIRVLLESYPLSKHVADRYGRTPTHWLLGAGEFSYQGLGPENVLHVSGEQKNPNAIPWYKKPCDSKMLQLLLTSRVARSKDGIGRNPLHWACFTMTHAIFHSTTSSEQIPASPQMDSVAGEVLPQMIAMQEHLPVLQQLVGSHTNQILGKDEQEQTPLMVLLSTFRELQLRHNFSTIRPHPVVGGVANPRVETSWIGLELSPALLKLLLHHPDSHGQLYRSSEKQNDDSPLFPISMEDINGCLPLHLAVSIGCGLQTISILIKEHPTGLVHTSETYQSPLHMAFSKQVTPYWTSAAMDLFLQTYHTGAHDSVVVDGRMALKMEDADGVYPIHYATQHNACLQVLETLLKAYPSIAHLVRHDTQDLAFFHLVPGHLDVGNPSNKISVMKDLLRPDNSNTYARRRKTMQESTLPLIRQKMGLFLPILLQKESYSAELLQRTDSTHHMHILHTAVLFQAADYRQLLRLLQLCPDSARHICNCLQGQETTENEEPPEWTVLDLHEAVKSFWFGTMGDWDHIRQLLFAHYPDVESHRHRQELLSQCCSIILQEVQYRPKKTKDEYRHRDDTTVKSSIHWHYMKDAEFTEKSAPDLEITHSLSAAESSVREKLNIKQPPAPGNVQPLRPPGTTRRTKNGNSQSKTAGTRTKKLLAAIGEYDDEDNQDGNEKSFQSKYDDDGVGYDARSEQEDDSDGSESYSSRSFSDQSASDEDGSYSSGSFTEDGDEYTESYDEYSISTNNRSRTFSSEADSRDWSPHSSKTMDTMGSRLNRKFNNPNQAPPDPDAFDRAFDGMVEDKKEEIPEKKMNRQRHHRKMPKSKRKNKVGENKFADRPRYMSEVGMRMWTFFTLYCDVDNPNDNYVDQLSAIFAEIPHAKKEMLVQLPLPPHSVDYIPMEDIFVGVGQIQTFRDAASPKCRELIHKTCYFVGKYEFLTDPKGRNNSSIEPNLVFCRPADQHLFQMTANEWFFTTQEATEAAVTPGLSEEEIWMTGVAPAETGATFRTRQQQVVLTFTQDPKEYENEVVCQAQIPEDGPVSRLLAHYNAKKPALQEDKRYRTDINDERFNKLFVGRSRVFHLQEFPFAMVHPAVETLDQVLSIYGGLNASSELKEISRDVGGALSFLHRHGLVHGNVCMKNIVREWKGDTVGTMWKVRDFMFGCRDGEDFMGRIGPNGKPLFATATLPPEMFVQLSSVELRACERYWAFVEKTFGITVEKWAIEPVVNPDTGDVCVVKCHYEQPEGSSVALPPLPYERVAASPVADFWGIGLLLFELTTGRPLFAVDPRLNRLLEFHRHANWNLKMVASLIYTHVEDHVCQDLFLQLLSPANRRAQMTMDKILYHPFFRPGDAQASSSIKTMIQTRRRDALAHSRMLQQKLHEASEKGWLEERTTRLDCWSFDLLAKFQASPGSIVRRIMARNDEAASAPTGIVVLPYRLVQTRQSVLTPENATKASATGLALLGLLKTCFFATELSKQIRSFESSEGKKRTISMSQVVERLAVSQQAFSRELRLCVELTSQHVESFRSDPQFIVQLLVKTGIEDFLTLFEETDSYVYLVDEFNYVPLLEGCWMANNGNQELVYRSILSTYLSCLAAWRAQSSVSGFAKLLFQSSFPDGPPEWEDFASSLQDLKVNDQRILEEITVLQEGLSGLAGCRHSLDTDLPYLRDFLSKLDPKRRLGEMHRVMVSSTIGLWTTKKQAQDLESECNDYTLDDALEEMRKM